MRFGSVCSGIEAASVAWHPLGWQAAWFSEIEPFPSAVLAHHYPDVPNLGDMTTLPKRILLGEVEAPDLFCGGTPCQAFSVAGLRRSLDDERGNLSLTFCEIADAVDHIRVRAGKPAAIVFWENVPGVLSTADNAFGCFLAGLAGEDDPLLPPGGKWSNSGCVYGPQRAVAWRTLDAQYFGVAQRRKRVFVVASARNDFDPAAVLFEWDGVRRDTAPSREAGKGAAGGFARSVALRGREGGGTIELGDDIGGCLRASGGGGDKPHVITMAHGQGGAEIGFDRGPTLTCNHEAPIAAYPTTTHTLRGEGFDASEDGTGRGTPLVPVAWSIMPQNSGRDYKARQVEVLQPLMAAGPQHGNQGGDIIQTAMQVRRLTPVECERLQGFPDNYTAIPWRKKPASECPDGPRYKALGNSWAVPVVRWIGRRIASAL
jgi:DNA (cytosine-5)-methyltransferase 1